MKTVPQLSLGEYWLLVCFLFCKSCVRWLLWGEDQEWCLTCRNSGLVVSWCPFRNWLGVLLLSWDKNCVVQLQSILIHIVKLNWPLNNQFSLGKSLFHWQWLLKPKAAVNIFTVKYYSLVSVCNVILWFSLPYMVVFTIGIQISFLLQNTSLCSEVGCYKRYKDYYSTRTKNRKHGITFLQLVGFLDHSWAK